MKMRLSHRWIKLNAAVLMLSAVGAYGQAEEGEALELSPFQVIGSKENLHFTPGSGYYVDDNEIVLHNYDNIEQIMRRVPGVYFRTEDGFGLFPNISFRGVGSMRTTQLTVMEDGVLSAPAPYSAPAAYYTPTSGRMSGLEILKGSSQIEYGPQTSGGVLNYLSTPLPTERSGRVRLAFGENNDMRFHGYYGEVFENELGQFSVLLEMYHRKNDGYKSIDTSPTYQGGDTGFTRTEPMIKIGWKPNTERAQELELKVGYSDMTADETYLGLSSADFAADPHRRYVSSQFDQIPTEHWRTYLRHSIELSKDSRLTSRVYYNQFSRAWYKLNDVRRIGGGSANLAGALAGGGFYNDSGDLIAGTEGEPLAILKGEAAGIWRVRDNNRSYKSFGADAIYEHRLETGAVMHFLEAGLRIHEDYEDRFQKQDDYTTDAAGNVDEESVVVRQRGTQDNRRGTSRALALYLRDSMAFGNWTVAPGVRYERVRYTVERRGTILANADFNQIISKAQDTLDVIAPGVSVLYDYNSTIAFFGGVHKGFSLPGPSGATSADPIHEETSIGYEAGVRFRGEGGLRSEFVLFYTDFNDLIVPESIGGAGTGASENAGDVRTYGFEFALAWNPGQVNGWAVSTPLQLAYTYTDATVRRGNSEADAESIFAGAVNGNRLPYIPRYQISLGAGLEAGKWGIYLDAFYVPSTYASANNSSVEVNPNTNEPDARFGKNDAYFLLDLTLRYQLSETVALNMGVQNLLDREYMASRLPYGPRPGHPRFVSAGITLDF